MEEKNKGLILNRLNQILVSVDDVDLPGTAKGVRLEVNVDKSKYMITS